MGADDTGEMTTWENFEKLKAEVEEELEDVHLVCALGVGLSLVGGGLSGTHLCACAAGVKWSGPSLSMCPTLSLDERWDVSS